MVLGELKVPLTRLPGVGPAVLRDLAKLGVTDCGKLLQHFPRDYHNRRDEVTLNRALTSGLPVNTLVQVTNQQWFGHSSRKTLKLEIVDRQGTTASLLCFHRNHLEKIYPVGAAGWLWGTIEFKFQTRQLSSFQLDPLPKDHHFGEPLGTAGKIEPVYPLAGHLSNSGIAKAVLHTFQLFVVGLEEDLPAEILEKYHIPPLRQLLWSAHFPETLDQKNEIFRHLAYRELFHLQTAVRRRPLTQTASQRLPQRFSRRLQKELMVRLPFQLTADQITVLEEIHTDLEADRPMGRLLQGDVGSGKTLVAFLSALPLIEAGFQCALMAPTELLALQHAENAGRLLDPLGVRVAYLSGNLKTAGRQNILKALAEGGIDLVIGTHALFSADVQYKNLRYILIDEQHRFGVSQRQALTQKGQLPDLLLMSATPIPRTLALTAFGDLKTSVIRTMPVGRKPIVTHTAKQSNQTKVYEFVRNELKAGRQAYFVYPLIESSEKSLDLKDAETMVKHLSETVFPEFSVALVHSRVDDEDKKRVMEDFSAGIIQVLVATSVVEVGVDVANATCMVIEHPERFGLSALHQLRGRVGRSSLPSYCFLVFSENLTEVGKQRLKVMMSTTDGFQIAEEDLKLRGPGDLTGVKQSGYLKLKTADLALDYDLLVQAREDVQSIFTADPGLLTLGNSGLRRLWEKAPPFSDDLVAL